MGYFENYTLEKGMYHQPGKSFSKVLEEIDESSKYHGTPFEGTDAFHRQLIRFNIRTCGPESSTVESFFQSSQSAVLFPEYVKRAIKQGIDNDGRINKLVATVTNIDVPDYIGITVKDECNDKFPITKIRSNDRLTNIQKRGKLLVSSYETLRFQKLDLLTISLRQIGSYIAATQVKDAVNFIISTSTPSVFTHNIPKYADIISLWGYLSPYHMNTIIASTAIIQILLNIPEMKNAPVSSPLSAQIVHSPNLNNRTIIALDKSCALEMVQVGDLFIDADKLIDRNIEHAEVSMTYGFNMILPAIAILSIS